MSNSDLISALQDVGTQPVGGGGRAIKEVYRYTMTMPQYADAVEETVRNSASSLSPFSYSPSVRNQTLWYARHGWDEDLDEVMDVCDRAVKMVETEVPVFEPINAVSGMSVDIGAAVAGLPEDMIDFPLTENSSLGRIITLCSDVQCLGSVSDLTVKKRGFLVAGLAMALNRIGYQTTYWVSDEYWTPRRPEEKVVIRILVKGPNDMIDPARIMFAYAHPGVQRELGFSFASQIEGVDGSYGSTLSYNGMGSVTSTTRDIGDNCLYLPPIHRGDNSPNIEAEIKKFLQVLGVIPGGDDD